MTDSPTPTVGLSRLVLGLMSLDRWGLERAALLERVHLCLDLGITAFDLADVYGDHTCEALFGEALALEPALRDRLTLVTKCGMRLVSARRPENRIKHYDTSRAYVVAAVERALAALRTDRIDLLLLHRPDPLMDPGETAEALAALRASGKVLRCGVSNFTAAQFEALASWLPFPLVTNQVEFSVCHVEPLFDGTLDHCLTRRIPPMAWAPLGGGRIFGDDERARGLRAALEAVGRDLGGASADQVALAWVLRHPAGILPVLGSGRPESWRAAAGALALRLERQQWFEILKAATGRDVP